VKWIWRFRAVEDAVRELKPYVERVWPELLGVVLIWCDLPRARGEPRARGMPDDAAVTVCRRNSSGG
jgi:hypothetical protein